MALVGRRLEGGRGFRPGRPEVVLWAQRSRVWSDGCLPLMYQQGRRGGTKMPVVAGFVNSRVLMMSGQSDTMMRCCCCTVGVVQPLASASFFRRGGGISRCV